MRTIQLQDGRDRQLKAQLIRAAQLLLEHAEHEGFGFHFDLDGERRYIVCGSKESIAVLSRQLSD